MRVQMHQTLPGGVTFSLTALDGTAGLSMKLRVEGQDEPYQAKIVDAQVDEDRTGYTITLEVPDDLRPILDPQPAAGLSFTIEPEPGHELCVTEHTLTRRTVAANFDAEQIATPGPEVLEVSWPCGRSLTLRTWPGRFYPETLDALHREAGVG